ncbi:MAG: M42 family peptidase [Anaerolineales bacterium]|nr:M42 family peptidase [Anaerolineales bacterium]
MPFDILAHLKALCAAPGLPGHEAPARDLLRAAWSPLTHWLETDRLGSLCATRQGGGPRPRPRLMLAAHVDTIGMLVTRLDGDFLRMSRLGDVDERTLPGQLVTVHGRHDLPGVIGQPPAYLLPKNGREQVTPLSELVVDTGLPAERLRALVQAGDLVSLAQPARELQNGLLAARGLDNRASVTALTLALSELQSRAHAWDVVAVATVQEEFGLRGAGPAAFALAPDLAIVIDVTFGRDANTRDLAYRTFPLGGGPVLGLGPNIHTGLHSAVKAAAERAEIPYNLEVMWEHSGTDAFGIQVAREGIPTMVISIPVRNMHTPVEIVALADVIRTGRLLAEFAAGLDPGFMGQLALD